MNLHDTHYRKLFSSPHMVRALFQGILPASLQAMLDLDTLEPLPTNYISAFLQERRGDLVWRVRRRDGIMLYLLIQLEHCQGIAQAQALLQKVLRLTRQPQYDELRRAFGSWVRHVLFSRTLPQATELALTDDLQEISTMLATRSRNWSENLRQEGRQEGAVNMLERQMTRKFGPLPDAIQQRLRLADGAHLETWSLNVIDAQCLEDVFKA